MILIVTTSTDTGQLYTEVMLKSSGYLTNVCTNMSNVSEFLNNSSPSLIIWHLQPLQFDNTLKLLLEIRDLSNNDQSIAILLIVPVDWSDPQIEALVDEILEFPPDQEIFLGMVKRLMRDK